MAWTPKVWVDRSVEFAGRRKLTAVPGLADTFDIARAEGTVFAVGDKPDAAALNNLETRIDDAITEIRTWIDITSQCTWSSSLLTTYTNYAKVNPAIRMIEVTCVLKPGRQNGNVVVTLPPAYRPTLTKRMGLGVLYSHVDTMEIEYYIDTNGDITARHSNDLPSGTAEFICFNFIY